MNTLAQICVGSVWDFTSNHFPLGKQPLFPSLFFLLFTQQDSQNTIFCCRKISINLFSMEFCELRWYKGGCYFDAIHSTERYFILCKIESINQIMEKLSICKFFQAFWSHFWFNTSSRKKTCIFARYCNTDGSDTCFCWVSGEKKYSEMAYFKSLSWTFKN